jgi:hypothetical protein
MRFVSELRDVLFVNWAIPRPELPTPRAPLDLDLLRRGREEVGFVTLLLFRQCGLRRDKSLWPSLSFPQCNLRILVRDQERVASVLFVRQLVPAWVVPLARAFARQPATAAILESTGMPGDVVRWSVAAGQRLVLTARPGAAPPEPLVPGSWSETVAFFRERARGYVETEQGLRRISAEHPASEALPMRVELEEPSWLVARLPTVAEERWSSPHSSFLIPSIRLAVAVDRRHSEVAEESLPAPGRAAVS